MNLTLVRHAYLPDCTLGWLFVGDQDFATIEEPWIKNKDGPGGQRRADGQESCVPDGDYILKPHTGTRFVDVYRLSNHELGVFDSPGELKSPAWGRAAILIHNGNTTDDIEGCILVGKTHGKINGKNAVMSSIRALGELRGILKKDLHTLTIKPTAGTI